MAGDNSFLLDDDEDDELVCTVFVFMLLSRLIGPTSFQEPFSHCDSNLTVSEFISITSLSAACDDCRRCSMMFVSFLGLHVNLCFRHSAR